MHCVAALDDAQVFVGDADLTTLSDKERTLIRRDRIGFVFEAFNLVPTLTAIENITLPMDIAGCKPDKEWLDAVINTVGLATGSITSRASSPAASNEGWPVPARWPAVRTSCSPTNPPATSTRSRARKCSGSCAARSASSAAPASWSPTTQRRRIRGQGVVPGDGHIVDEIAEPTAERVLDRMKSFDAAGHAT